MKTPPSSQHPSQTPLGTPAPPLPLPPMVPPPHTGRLALPSASVSPTASLGPFAFRHWLLFAAQTRQSAVHRPQTCQSANPQSTISRPTAPRYQTSDFASSVAPISQNAYLLPSFSPPPPHQYLLVHGQTAYRYPALSAASPS